ncbi:kallikrein-1-like, partial [Equus quagga]|uniref:kallikrein-1-like n=1 Tax=Equus quagga TaxID=89248 RepID=UPI001EE19730
FWLALSVSLWLCFSFLLWTLPQAPRPHLPSPFPPSFPPSPSLPGDDQVWLGRYDSFEDKDTVQFLQVSDSFPHPDFKLSLLKQNIFIPGDDCSHNLMLLRLEQPTQLTAAVQVLALPTQEPALWNLCLMYPDGLPCVDLTLLSNDVCAKSSLEMVTEFLSCAGPLEVGKET